MLPTNHEPIQTNWTDIGPISKDQSGGNVDGRPGKAVPADRLFAVRSASEIAAKVGVCNLDDLRPHYALLVETVAELAQASQVPWTNAHDDPLVVLLRVLARIAIVAPEATSHAAAALEQRL